MLNISTYTNGCSSDTVVRPRISTLKGSMILRIASQVRALQAEGRAICNLTVGDFNPNHFPIPEELADGVAKAYRDGQTNYPPSDGIPELREAIDELYQREFGLNYGPSGVCVASGARPPLFATYSMCIDDGDVAVSFLPSWNNSYYAHLFNAEHRLVETTAGSNFHPTVEQIQSVISEAKLIALNSPLNPTGTMIDKDVLTGIAKAVVEENLKREHSGKRPVMMLFDQVYWMLIEEGQKHFSPVQLVPEVAPYVIHVDAISKSFAATGLRVGWGVLPSHLQPKMKAIIGHVGAWAARPEQVATAQFLRQPEKVESFMSGMKQKVSERLALLYQGILQMKEQGMPVDAIAPQGALYMSFHVGLSGPGFETNEDIRQFLLQQAGVAVVPFQAFDMPSAKGWFRMSVGACSKEDLVGALERLETALRSI